MKNFGIVFFLYIVCLSSSVNVLSQDDARQIYERILIAQNTSIKLEIQSNSIIQQYLRYYQGRGWGSMKKELSLFNRHEKMIRRIFREESVPDDLVYMNPTENVWGRGRKALWSFNPQIAPKYGLLKTKTLDETRSFEKATRATARYLKFLFNKYNQNWELALGAYKLGERIIDLAIKKAKSTDYWKIHPYLPHQAQYFVPSILATILIANNLEKYGFENIRRQPPLEYELVRIPPSITFKTISKLSETPLEKIIELNPEFISGVTPANPYIVRVPVGKGQAFAERMRKYNPRKSEQ